MNPLSSREQMTLDFRPGLTERYETVLDCIKSSIYSNEKPIKSIAASMDMSPSDLSRKLAGNPDDPRRFSVSDLERYIELTGDTTPVLYLAQKFCVDVESRQKAALSALAALTPHLQSLLKAAGA